ncbi:MAG: hypothetical protein WEB58_09215 [Planctomycetaceae bacterium]
MNESDVVTLSSLGSDEECARTFFGNRGMNLIDDGTAIVIAGVLLALVSTYSPKTIRA